MRYMNRCSFAAIIGCLIFPLSITVQAETETRADLSAFDNLGGYDRSRAKEELSGGTFKFKQRELLELESVDKVSIERLANTYAKTDPVFRKYRYFPILPGGVDHLAAGTGTRNAGYGTIRLRGVVPGAVPVSAFLYWGGIEASPAPTQAVSFQGKKVLGLSLGNAAQPCWNPAGTFVAYRANVLPLLLAGINGDYSIAKLPSAITNGQNPWGSGQNTRLPLSEGASLVVLYSHASIPNDSFVEIHHPMQMFAGNATFSHFLTRTVLNNTALKHTRLGADGQAGAGVNHIPFLSDERSFIGGFPGLLTQIKGDGVIVPYGNRDSDWNGYDGEPLNQLWDTHTQSVPGSIPNGFASYQVSYRANGDCIVPVAHVLTAR
ncbi:MAG: hypothetical protein GXP08_04450 [Gammaproteobacteria bacterium]|nr:hypothetical protein [Gammaproteobacteria bacterium]